jgi:hypothetical protein
MPLLYDKQVAAVGGKVREGAGSCHRWQLYLYHSGAATPGSRCGSPGVVTRPVTAAAISGAGAVLRTLCHGRGQNQVSQAGLSTCGLGC